MLLLLPLRFRPFVSALTEAVRVARAGTLRFVPLVPASALTLRFLLAVPRRLAPLVALAPPASAAAVSRLPRSCWVGCGLTPRSSGGSGLALGSAALGLSDPPPLAVRHSSAGSIRTACAVALRAFRSVRRGVTSSAH